MRAGVIGFFTGVLVVLLGLLAFQLWVIRTSAEDLDYRFSGYVFSGTKFPWGYLDQGRAIKRCLFPVRLSVTYYDAKYHEVAQADGPGRYGAVVRMALTGGIVQYRFITLYRTPTMAHGSVGTSPAKITAQLPAAMEIDPVVLQNQAAEIGDTINSNYFGDFGLSPSVAVLLAGLAETSPNDPPAVARTNVENRNADWWFGLRLRLGLVTSYPHLIDLPQDYGAKPNERWPLILYCHSGIHFGHDLRIVRASGLAGLIANGRQLPAVVVSPQCPQNESWNVRVLKLLIDEVSAKYRIDPDRIYVTGISAGGDAAFDFATAYPDMVAAIAPIAGDGDPADAARIKDIPLWDFHGLKDDVVPPDNPIALVKALRQLGGHPHQTLYPDTGHYDSWALAYGTEALYPWLLAQKRGQPEVVTPGVPIQ